MIHNIKDLEKAQFIAKTAKKVYGVDPFESIRNRHNTIARAAIAVELRNSGETYQAIGFFLNKNHTTILHYLKRHFDHLNYDPIYKQYFEAFLIELQKPVNNETWILESIKNHVEKINAQLVDFNYQASEIVHFWNNAIKESLAKTP